MAPIITVENLIKRYKKATENAVDDISFSVEPGEFFTLLGPNGAGKTTVISILTTTLSKTSGKISITGLDIDAGASTIRQNLGIIFQKPSLDLNLTAEENVRFHAVLYGLYPFRPTFAMMPAEYRTKVHELAKLLDIDATIFKPMKTFSGGMKRKLEIVRSLLHSPKILFLDEPTTGLDPISRRNLWEYLQEVRKTMGTTIFLTTHYLEEAEVADRVCVINHGKIIQMGTPGDLKKNLITPYVQLTTEQIQSLLFELTERNLNYEVVDGLVRVNISNVSVVELIQSLKTPISDMLIHRPTLEDAYVKLISNENEEEHEATV